MERVDVIRIHFKMAATIIKKKMRRFLFWKSNFHLKVGARQQWSRPLTPDLQTSGDHVTVTYRLFAIQLLIFLLIYLSIYSFIHSHDCRSADSHRLTSDPASVTGTGGERTWLENGVTCDDVLESDTR